MEGKQPILHAITAFGAAFTTLVTANTLGNGVAGFFAVVFPALVYVMASGMDVRADEEEVSA